MGKINILSREVADLIAAGEVVGRPGSVVKELLENSFDAGADSVTVEIQNGGILLIRVTDNGEGMSADDAERAFALHATSKIKNASDLESIMTLGFRGEALASIAAVSKIELITRRAEDEFGTHLILEGGKTVLKEEIGCGVGTVLSVSDLFYNTPARLKFLKKDAYEAGRCYDAAVNCALGYEGVSVKFIKDGKMQFQTNSQGGLLNCIYAIYGRDIAKALIETNCEYNGIKVSGFVSKPEEARGNRQLQSFYINGRYAKAKILTAALESAYSNRIITGRYPFCFLKIDVDYREVDVNVHPAKTEVRFSREREIFEAVRFAVLSAIDGQGDFPDYSQRYEKKPVFEEEKSLGQMAIDVINRFKAPVYKNKETDITESEKELKLAQTPLSPSNPVIEIPSVFKNYINSNITLEAERTGEEHEQEEEPADYEPEIDEYRIVGEAMGLYIIVDKIDELLLIDKHAAHERMIFDRLKAQGEISSQVLLMPETMTLSGQECAALLGKGDILSTMGFEIEDFGGHSIIIRRMPAILNVEQGKAALLEIAQKIIDTQHIENDLADELYHSIACRAAIKANAKNSIVELCEIVDAVLKYKKVRYCPHGRPVAVSYSKYSIDKQFLRV